MTLRRYWILLGIALLPMASSPAMVSGAERPAEAQATFRFDIPPGPLDAALTTFKAVSGYEVAIPPHATVQGLSSPGVSGVFSADHALDRLLAGTGLSFRLSAANTYTIQVRPLTESIDVHGTIPYRVESSATATRTLTPLRDVPQSVTVVTAATISDQRMQSMADVVRYIPGIGMAQGEGNRDTPIFRGNSSTSDFFVDGIRDDGQYFRDLYNVDRIEAVKGPNAMIFGRGGVGGIINRATRQADWGTARELTLQGGSQENRRLTLDLDHPLGNRVAARLTGLYENSGSYRQGVDLERYGINPTVAFMVGSSTSVRAGFERFHDHRTADRGIPSSGNRPVATRLSTFFGDPELSRAIVSVNALSGGVDHGFGGGAVLRSRTRYTDYDKIYQNIYPGSAVAADGSTVSLSAYNNATGRQNLFNQTDVNFVIATGRVKHVLLAGAELGRQVTGNFRNTGYFISSGPNATSLAVPVSAPTVSVPVAFRQSATDASNHGVATTAAVYGQDQVELSRRVQIVFGLRYDRFDVSIHNNRTNADLSSRDDLIAPRAGFIYKPAQPVSVYASYSLAFLPRAGEQLSSLSLTNQALDPERFSNYEVGTKWDVGSDLSVTAAAYRLDRTNVVIPNPADVSQSLLVDGQRTKGLELGLSGRIARGWSAIGGYAYQDGRITRTLSSSAQAGAALAQVPAHTFSLWNRYDVRSVWGFGFGVIHSAEMFTSTDNTVGLPGFTRIDAALLVTLNRRLRAQANLENAFDARYFASANGNNNITPGAPRLVRLALVSRF